MLGRKTLKSERARMRRIDAFFEQLGYLILIASFLFTMSAWLSYRESIRIQGVEISGAHAVNEADVLTVSNQLLSQRYLWKIDRNNRLLYPKQSLATAISSLDTHIKDVRLSVTPEKKLHIGIEEYTPSILWCSGNEETDDASSTERCFLADKNGYVFASAPTYSGYPFTVFRTAIAGSEENGSPVGLNLLSRDQFDKLLLISDILAKRGVTIHQVEQVEAHDYDLFSDRPWVIRFTTDKDATTTVNNLFLVENGIAHDKKATSSPHLIDLRFGNKIFYK